MILPDGKWVQFFEKKPEIMRVLKTIMIFRMKICIFCPAVQNDI